MKKLRSFIYLDNYKMYSISSQLFEGLTEYIVTSKTKSETESEKQKGPLFSGRILADIIEKNTSETEKKFLHDFSYNLFEETLVKEGRVLEIDAKNLVSKLEEIDNYSFVKLTGNIIFNDLKSVEHTIKNFNQIGEALGYLQHKAAYDKEMKEFTEAIRQVKDREQKAKLNHMSKSKADFKKILREQGLQMDDEFLKHLAFILDYGYNQQFEAQLPMKSENDEYYLFSAQLKRENLKDDEYSIIKKYSRETEKEFKLFGIVTQRLTAESKSRLLEEFTATSGVEKDPGMKEALMVFVSSLANIESTFTGKLNYEYVIDPIALYMEI